MREKERVREREGERASEGESHTVTSVEVGFQGIFHLFLSICRCGLVECGRKLLNALPDIGEGEEEGTDEYWVSIPHIQK